MKTLIENHKAGYSSEVVEYKGKRYKIICSNGNCYSKLAVYFITANGLSMLATENDIPKYQTIDYIWSDRKRENAQLLNLGAAEAYIKSIF